jgi:hypothetical protein
MAAAGESKWPPARSSWWPLSPGQSGSAGTDTGEGRESLISPFTDHACVGMRWAVAGRKFDLVRVSPRTESAPWPGEGERRAATGYRAHYPIAAELLLSTCANLSGSRVPAPELATPIRMRSLKHQQLLN